MTKFGITINNLKDSYHRPFQFAYFAIAEQIVGVGVKSYAIIYNTNSIKQNLDFVIMNNITKSKLQ